MINECLRLNGSAGNIYIDTRHYCNPLRLLYTTTAATTIRAKLRKDFDRLAFFCNLIIIRILCGKVDE